MRTGQIFRSTLGTGARPEMGGSPTSRWASTGMIEAIKSEGKSISHEPLPMGIYLADTPPLPWYYWKGLPPPPLRSHLSARQPYHIPITHIMLYYIGI